MTYKMLKKVIVSDGWCEVRSCGSHYQFKKVGNPFVVTVPDHGPKDLTIGVIKSIERKTGLSLR